MTAPTSTFDLLEFVLRAELRGYRRARMYQAPFAAATEQRDSAARFLADAVLETDGRPDQFTVEQYRAALAIYDAVVKRSTIGTGVAYRDLTRCQQFWNTGKVGAA